jgi:hypothetical protein
MTTNTLVAVPETNNGVVRGVSRVFFGLCALPGLLLVAGCTTGAGGNSLNGKVTLNGQPVNGIVTLTSTDGKEFSAPTAPDGSYTMVNLPKGQMKVSVKAGPSMGPPMGGKVIQPKDKEAIPGAPPADNRVAPPVKYANPDNGLTVDVKGGKQPHDIPLSP